MMRTTGDPDGAPVIRTVELTRRFGDLIAANAVSLTVAPLEVFGLLGPNGAGKSTVIKMLTTLLPPTSGRAWVAGFDVGREPAGVRRSIGYVPQVLSADGALTGYENLLLSARLYSVPRREQARRIQDALALMGLRDAADSPVRQYSGGMIRRLEVAQSMLHHPAVLFMDEPTVGLDPVARQVVWEHVRELRQRLGTTVFLTTHLMPGWLRGISVANPLTYEVDALRALMISGGSSGFGLGVDFVVLLGASAVLVGVAARLYPRMAA